VKLCGNLAQDIPADRTEIPISTEETDDTFFLLKRLNESIQENTVETAVLKSDVILVMLVERVHGHVSFQFSLNRRINPDASTSCFHAGLSSTRHLEPRDGLRRRHLRVRGESAGTGEIQSGLATSACSDIRAIEHRRGLWLGTYDKRLLVLVDGLDEHSSNDAAQIALNHLDVFLTNCDVPVIATTRPHGSERLGINRDGWHESTMRSGTLSDLYARS
jgi:hypothetical protein